MKNLWVFSFYLIDPILIFVIKYKIFDFRNLKDLSRPKKIFVKNFSRENFEKRWKENGRNVLSKIRLSAIIAVARP